ncbi:P-loop containing nucleoside triphosphate hydrolase protein [Pelagophyceae sp. CCMP2097]|nr:P-loop containing nucleoside triphosphate hydrolase protein [Pelagophyceae sp. CCMP2097]
MPPKKVVTEDVNLKASRWGRVKSNLKMGVVGLPNVGKSSLFNLLTEQSAAAENFPFCTIEPNEARCPVPDQRFKWLCDLFKPPSRVPAQLQVTDIAGLIRGAAEGAGLGNAFLSHIQAVDGLYHVVRAFESEEVIHVDDSVDPLRDLETIQIELSKKDLEYFTKQVQAFEEVKKGVKPKKLTEAYMSARDKIKALLEACKPALMAEFTDGEIMDIKHVVPALITTKPVVYLVNLSKKSFVTKKSKWLPKIAAWIAANGGGQAIPFSVEYEEELFRLRADKAAVEQLIKDNDGAKSVLPRIVKVGFKELNLIYFFTAGDKEVRAWNIYNGSLAPQAAGAIHSDFERGFIKAEIAAFDDFKEHHGDKATMANLKALGKYRMEGKQYLVKDGDIIEFKFNVSK